MLKNKKIKSASLFIFTLIILFGVFIIISNKIPKQDKTTTENIKTTKVVLEINGVSYQEEAPEGTSVYDFMSKLQNEGKITFKEKTYVGMGKLIEEINGIKSDGKKFWIYYINNTQAQVGVSDYKIKSGDIISWRYEAF